MLCFPGSPYTYCNNTLTPQKLAMLCFPGSPHTYCNNTLTAQKGAILDFKIAHSPEYRRCKDNTSHNAQTEILNNHRGVKESSAIKLDKTELFLFQVYLLTISSISVDCKPRYTNTAMWQNHKTPFMCSKHRLQKSTKDSIIQFKMHITKTEQHMTSHKKEYVKNALPSFNHENDLSQMKIQIKVLQHKNASSKRIKNVSLFNKNFKKSKCLISITKQNETNKQKIRSWHQRMIHTKTAKSRHTNRGIFIQTGPRLHNNDESFTLFLPSATVCQALFSTSVPSTVQQQCAKHCSAPACQALFSTSVPSTVQHQRAKHCSAPACQALFSTSVPSTVQHQHAKHCSAPACQALFSNSVPSSQHQRAKHCSATACQAVSTSVPSTVQHQHAKHCSATACQAVSTSVPSTVQHQHAKHCSATACQAVSTSVPSTVQHQHAKHCSATACQAVSTSVPSTVQHQRAKHCSAPVCQVLFMWYCCWPLKVLFPSMCTSHAFLSKARNAVGWLKWLTGMCAKRDLQVCVLKEIYRYVC